MRGPVTRGLALYGGAGFSVGKYESFDPAADHSVHVYEPAGWVLIETGLDVRLRGGFALRAYFGVAPLLNASSFECRDAAVTDPPPLVRPCDADHNDSLTPYRNRQNYFGIGLGCAFRKLWPLFSGNSGRFVSGLMIVT